MKEYNCPDCFNKQNCKDCYRLVTRDAVKAHLYIPYMDNLENPCDKCPFNPINGGDGVCNCVLGNKPRK